MAKRSAHDFAAAWTGADGPWSRAAEWVAIAMGESGLDDAAVSPDGAIGGWQIMPSNAHIGGGTVGDLYDLNYNAKVAVIMSSGGSNCAAWDSCYLDIYRSGRYSYLAYPEKGSVDWNNLAVAAVAIGVASVAQSIPEPSLGIGGDIGNLVGGAQNTIGVVLPQLHSNVLIEQRTVNSLAQPGWRAWAYSRR